MLACQQMLLVDAATAVLQQVGLLPGLRVRLSCENAEQFMQLQWHNKWGEIKLSLHNLVDAARLASIDNDNDDDNDGEQLNKFTATKHVAGVTRVGTALYIRLQPTALLVLALHTKQTTRTASADVPSPVLVCSWLPPPPSSSSSASSELTIDAFIRAQLVTQSTVHMMRSEGTPTHWLMLLPTTQPGSEVAALTIQHRLEEQASMDDQLQLVGIQPDQLCGVTLKARARIRQAVEMSPAVEAMPQEDNATMLDLMPFGANRLLLPPPSHADAATSTDILFDVVAALLVAITEHAGDDDGGDGSGCAFARIITIAPETCQMQVQQIYALLKVLSMAHRSPHACPSHLDYVPVGPVQHRSTTTTTNHSSIRATTAYIQGIMRRMADDKEDGNHSSSDAPCSNASIVDITTAAAFSGVFMETKRQKQIQLLEEPGKQLVEKGQPMVYMLYTRARLRAILNAYATQHPRPNANSDDDDVEAYAVHLASTSVTVDIAREILHYPQVARAALDRYEPCLLVAFAVRLSRLTTKACDTLRVKDCPARVALPRVHLLGICELMLSDVIRRLGMLPLERM
ncbi:hypothetical protein SYNPS1DRAFT_28454 [Syncephalis pseudoplumigaleata]|uniref:arginine--tRNA ligase n=1 Tax=Syncephalis pseudoplumigaleata TaxID=1712513 RepID=A0A4V1J1P9_9FUNG|nr:hypothetical protein SYNPS1DRAFT_28454 [Syncephalis pseudoplumigaleata]|eukprot:RKP25819.1 hypothetical protein SYNPS1DRAFT_28454 [Syncephalis pseudoplumigaleata]